MFSEPFPFLTRNRPMCNTHIHVYIYIYIYVCVCVCVFVIKRYMPNNTFDKSYAS